MLGNAAGTPVEVAIGDGSGRVYRLRKPSVLDRVRLKGELARIGAISWGALDMLAGLARAVREVLAGDEAGRDGALALIEERHQEVSDLLERVRAGELVTWSDEWPALWAEAVTMPRALAELADELALREPGYARMIAENAAYPLARGVAYARVLLTGWEGVDQALSHRGGLVADEAIDLIPDHHLVRIGEAVERQLTITAGQKKASLLPSGGSSAPAHLPVTSDAAS